MVQSFNFIVKQKVFEGFATSVHERNIIKIILEMTSNSMPKSLQKLYEWQAPESDAKQLEKSPNMAPKEDQLPARNSQNVPKKSK